jgi:ABC-type multidrug transport system ATPase subunit
MITGDEIPSSGNAFAHMFTLLNQRNNFLANIGYCPQFDGIVGVLTGRQMLELFCRLRGIPNESIAVEADRWLHKLGLFESGDVQCQKYSGGMKRRLSAAMALVGDLPLILLDEPTSGVDPVARRQFWQVIESVRDAGQAVILTSHSMEECEALCSRLGIMVNGQFQCMGGVQHLKNKFAQGYSILLKLKPLIPPESSEVNALHQDISTRFHPCALKDRHQNVLKYQVFNTSMSWDILFKTLEDFKTHFTNVLEDYTVSETSLEEVFLSFARQQYPNRTADVSTFKKIITCQW